MASVKALRALLKVAELEEDLAKAKATGEPVGQGLQLRLREARRDARELRDAEAEPVAPGDASVRPATIESKVSGVN